MPYKDPDKKREHMRAWRKDAIAKGYGKWLYQRRKLRFDDAERFKQAAEVAIEALSKDPPASKEALAVLIEAKEESAKAEYELGLFEETIE